MSDDLYVLVDFGLGHTVVAPYVNYAGEVQVRRFVPRRFFVGSTSYDPEPALLIEGFDLDHHERRIFTSAGFIAGFKAEGNPP